MDKKELLRSLLKQSDSPVDGKVATMATTVETSVTKGFGKERKETPVTDEVNFAQVLAEAKKKPVGYVSVEYGANINLGNYNMAKVKVSASVPTAFVDNPEQFSESMQKAFDFAQLFVQKKVDEEVGKLKKL